MEPRPADPTHTRGIDALAVARARFVERWGAMAGCWGVPRSMAEVHALLFVEGRALTAEEVVARLGISRGNASMTLRTLVEWGIVTRITDCSGRKEQFAAEQDVWRLFATVIRARKRREIDPLNGLLGECRALADRAPGDDPAAADFRAKMDEMLRFVRELDALSEHFLAIDGPGLGGVFGALERER